ncbi:MAG: threonine ammonia-lyase, biosynthetic [Pseudomonadota bacterium]
MPTPTNTYDWPALIDEAMTRVYDVARETSLQPAKQLSAAIHHQVLLKREDQQPVFSFKLRGAYNRIAALNDQEAARGVICSSAGNHAQGVALAASMRGVPAVIVMPATTPRIKINAVRRYPVEVILEGDNYDAAQAEAKRLAAERQLTFIHPFDDPLVIAGQATIGRELLTQCEPFDLAFIPIGGGGLAAGVATAIKLARPDVRIIGVEPQQAASMQAAFEASEPVTLARVGNFADGVAVRRVGALTYSLCRELLDDIITVNTDQICAAIRDIYEETRTMVEPAGALSIAGIKAWVDENHMAEQRIVSIVCGANLNFDRLRHIAERAAVGEHREALFGVTIEEQPGSFRRFCHALGERNVTEFNYRIGANGDAQLFVGVELSEGVAEQEAVGRAIRDAGYDARDLSDNEVAKLHVRHLVGGRAADMHNEHVYRFEFPERPGALRDFLDAVGEDWNISLFHYRNHGSDFGRILVGIQIPDGNTQSLTEHFDGLGFPYWDETNNPAYRLFLT